MPLNLEPVKKWFGYDRKERRASFMLLIIIGIVLAVRVTVPGNNAEIEDITIETETTAQSERFNFDPNTASYDTLIKLGLDGAEAQTLINYRNNGGKFRQAADFKKLYGVEEAKAGELIPLIRIEQDTTQKIFRKQKLIDLNSCDSAMLESLPGIGPVLSVRIIKYRNLLGGFSSASQLREVYGLPPETFEIIRSRVTADPSALRKVNINTAEYRELSRSPYLENYEVSAILKYRELAGKIKGVEELVENKIISSETAEKINPYLEF